MILQYVSNSPGKTAREIAEHYSGEGAGQRPAYHKLKGLQKKGGILCKKRDDGKDAYYPLADGNLPAFSSNDSSPLPRFLAATDDSVAFFLNRFRERHETFSRNARFKGPSLYFHHKALKAVKQGPIEFADASYAMLVSWGMHRMGPKGAKMIDFETYCQSLASVWDQIVALRHVPEGQAAKSLDDLKKVFLALRVMDTRIILVAHSKVLAHALPHLVAPIDRQYTLRFFNDEKPVAIKSDHEWQWIVFRELHARAFYPIVQDHEFRNAADAWMKQNVSPWDTSLLKIVDNCVMSGEVKNDASNL